LADNLIDTVKKDYQEFLARGVARKKAMQAQQSNSNSVSPYAGYDPYITPYQQYNYAYSSYAQPMSAYAQQTYPTGYEAQWTGGSQSGYNDGQEGSFRSHL